MVKGYTNKTELENYLLIDIDASFWTQVERWIEDIEKYIDNKTGRNFIADSMATIKKYDGDNTTKLLIDDCVDVTELRIGTDMPLIKDESGEDDDYFLYPLNSEVINRIELVNGYFPRWPRQTVSVKAKWGFSAVCPGDIRNTATVMVAGIINYSLQAEGEVKSMSIGRYNVTYKDEKQWQDFDRVEEILKNYVKYNFN